MRGEQRTRGSFAVGCAFYFLNLLIVMRGGLGVCVLCECVCVCECFGGVCVSAV